MPPIEEDEERTTNSQGAVRDLIVLQKPMGREVFGVENVWWACCTLAVLSNIKLTWSLVTSAFGFKKFARGIPYTRHGACSAILYGHAKRRPVQIRRNTAQSYDNISTAIHRGRRVRCGAHEAVDRQGSDSYKTTNWEPNKAARHVRFQPASAQECYWY